MMTSVVSENLSKDVSQALTLAHLLRWRARHQSERMAYTFLLNGEIEEACLTYSELDRQARSIAAMLQKLDASGKRVLLLYPPGLEYIAAFFGCFYAGAVAVPAYPPRQNRSLVRLQTIIADAQASVVLTTETIHSKVGPLLEEAAGIKPLDWATTDDLAHELADEWREPVLGRESLAFLQYTSGSTTTPRGVMVSHGNLLHNQRLIQQTFRQTEESIILGWLPLYHDMGLIGNVLQPLYVGARCILMSPVAFLQKPSRWLQAISRYRATTSGAPNFAYDLCARKTTTEQRAELDLSSWTTAFNGAEPVRSKTLERFAQTFEYSGFRRQAFHPCYGLAEATLLVSGGAPERTESIAYGRAFKKDPLEHNLVIGVEAESVEARALVACGRALPEQRVVVVNPDTLMQARPDEVGEIWVSGASVTQGYWNRPEETEHTFGAYLADTGEGPFLRTGDLGFLDAGELFITGRLKDLIIIRGRNHYPQDIEQTVVQSHPVVEGGMGAAFSVEVEGEERLVVVQEINQRANDSAAVLESIVEAIGREYDVQVYAVVLVKKRSLPKTSSGKIQRHACRDEFLNASLQAEAEWRDEQTASLRATVAGIATGSDTQPTALTAADGNTQSLEAWLTAQLASLLGVSETRIERHRPVVRYGVDSLMAVELTHEIETRFGVILPTVSLLQDTSIAELVVEVQAQLNASASPATPTLARGSQTEDAHLLSRGQQGLWFMHQLAPESAAYNISSAVRLRAELDSAALRRAFQSLTMRHASLRTTFEAGEDGTPWLRVHEYVKIFFQEEDASTWSDAALRGRLVEEAHRPFDLEHGPLLRVNLFRRSMREHILLLSLHHIVTDFWSLGILMRELGALYEGETSGATLDLAPLPVEYSDYARWQTNMLAGDEGERLWSYWQEKLAGELPVLDVPADAPRPLAQTFRGASEGIVFDAKLTAELKALSQAQGTTLYMTLLAAFQVLLYRYTGQEDLLVGSPTAGRSRAELAGLAGYFVNPVVLREDLSGNPTFKEFMGRVRGTVLDAFAHQDYPFSLLVERLQPVRTSIYPPLFQAMFVLQKAHQQDDALASFALSEEGARMNLGGLEVESITLEQRVAQVDLTLVTAEMEGGLAASFQYSTDLFEPSTIRQMLGHLESVLRVASATPDARLAALPLLNASERQQLLVEWNDTQTEFESEACVHSLFEAQVERTPDAVAVVFEDEQVTYAELNRRANQLAHHLQSLGVGAETLVGICIERSIETVVGLLGILKAGGAYLPLDVSYPPERHSFMLGDAHAPLLLTLQHRAPALAPYAPRLLCLDSDWPQIALNSDLNPRATVSADNLAYVIYTSGSTGKPKGVLLQHRGLVNLVAAQVRAFDIRPESRLLQFASLSFDASVSEIFTALLAGATLLMAKADELMQGESLVRLLREQQVTVVTLPPVVLGILDEREVPELATVVSAGEACTAEIAARWTRGRRFINAYGPTEATVCATLTIIDGDSVKPTIGRPIENVAVYVLDEQLEIVPIGVTGELYIGGAGVGRGYLGRPELTAERFVPDRFGRRAGGRLYRTGDLVRYLRNGQLEYLGRIDQQVKIRGFRIELGEIQAALLEHPDLSACAVLDREDHPGDKRLVAYIVFKHDSPISIADLREYLKERLPDYMMPAHFVTLDELPLTHNGKLNRRALPSPADFRDSISPPFTAPRSPLEELLASIFSRLLRVERVGIHDNFFELGGHSLLATQLISRIKEAFSVELPLRTVFESATISDLCLKIEQEIHATGGHSLPPLRRVSREEALPLSFAQQRLWFLHQLEPESAVYNMPAAVRLSGQLNIGALEATLTEIVRRHESLRTSFAYAAEQPSQVIHAAGRWRLSVVDVSELEESERTAEVERMAEEEARRPFDLQESPLLRTTLVKEAEAEQVLLWTMHHIISDGWSMGVLMREVAALYEAFVRGAASPLEELPIQYADYAVWQRETLNEEVIERQLSYWRQQLGGELPVLELPTDNARPAVQTFRGAVERVMLSGKLSEGLREVSRREGATLYMVLLAAFKVLLMRYTGQEEIIVGSPIAGRNRVETEGLIGFFLNTLALRTDLSGGPTFQELLARVNEVTIGAYTHQEVPFEKLLEELNPERRLGRSPVFQVLFNMLNFPASEIELPGLKIESRTALEVGSKFDLTLYVNEQEEGIRFTLVYNTDLFKRERMVEMLEQFRHLLAQVSDDPSMEIERLSLVTPGAAKLLPEPTQAIHAQWQGAVHQLFAEHARKSPDHLAVTDRQGTWTYGQLEERSNQLANYLHACGIQRQDVVAVYAHRSATLVWAIYGILKAGATFLILDPAYPELRLINYLGAAKPRGWLQLEEAGALPPALKDFVESLSCYAHLTLQPRAASEAQSFLLSYSIEDTGVAVGTGDTLAKYPVDDPSVEVAPDDIACITFTSGSTGTPKGVLGRHLALTPFANWTQTKFGINEHDRFSMLSGLAHDPLQRDIFTPLQLGASLSIPDPREIGTHGWLARWMKQEGISVTNLTPAMGQMLTETATESGDYELSSLRYAFFVGDMLTRRDIARLEKLAPSVTSINLYGATETQRAFGFFAHEHEARADEALATAQSSAKEALPVGRGIDGVQLLVLNAAEGLAGIGELGEIYFRSPYLARGYQEDEELTRQRFITNPFTGLQDDRLYKTGDIGRYLPDGNVEMLGRLDDQVKIRGFRIELGEIRSAIAEHPAIQDCAVLAREEQPGDKRLVAYIVFKHDSSMTVAELREFLKERLPDYMMPAHFVTLEELPLTPNGKLNRRALPPAAASRDSLSQSFTAPRSPLEELLASIFSRLLRVERVGIHDNFFELGGHSLLATQLISRIREAFSVDLPLRTVFESATVSELCAKMKIEQEIQATGGNRLPPLRRVSREEALPLSFAQQRLWFLHQLEPESAVYNMPAAVRLSGQLNRTALEATLTEIVRRHESLRTSFTNGGEEPRQVIHRARRWSLSVVDLRELGASEGGAEVERLAAEEARRPFALQTSPLLRTTLVEVAEAEQVLLWTMHHIISDGWSMGVLMREVAALYEAFVRGAASPLEELPIQYADYAVWQRETLNEEVIERQLSYWRQQLGGELPVLELPTDNARPAVQTFRGAVERVMLSGKLSEGLREVSRREGATLYMVLLAAFKVLLMRYTGQEEIIVGTPIAGRNRVETEGLIGFFVNTLVLRTEVRGEDSFGEVVRRVREVVLEGHAHQEVPFEKLVEELKPKRDLSRSPLFQVAFMFQSAGEKELASSGLSLSMLQSHAGASKFDVTLSLVDDGQELSGTLEYNTDLYEAATMERLAANFKTLLDGVVANQARRVSELPLLTTMEETRIITEWNQTVKTYDKESCIHQLFEAQVERTPESVALVFADERVTYAELNRRANQLAHHLRSLGVGAETLVGICVERSVEMVVGLLGILKAGGAYVPLDPSYPAQRLGLMLEDSRIKVLLTQRHLLKALPVRAATLVFVDDDREAIARKSEENPSRGVTGRNLAYVIYTSGSTGRPKGVQIEHAAVVNFLTSMLDEPGLTSDDVLLAVTSLSFDIAGLELFLPLVIGAREVLVSREVASDGTQLRECLSTAGITAMQATPATYRLLLNAGWDDLSGIKILCGGEAFPRELANQLIEKCGTVWNMYGPTESTIWSAVARVEMKDGAVAIGRPITNTQIYLLDPQLRPVPIGVAGELFIGGDGLTRGYLHLPKLTAEKMVPSPFDEKGGARLYRTGDVARFLPDGNIEFLGRIDHQVKVRGHRIELGEIEVALVQHEAVEVCVVLAREDVPGDNRLVAYIVPDTTMLAPTVSELRDFLRDRLPDYMIPSSLVVLEALPLTPNGKIDRRALPTPDGARPTLEAPFVAPRNDLERSIASVWQEVLNVSKVGIHDNFFDLGGHSMSLVQIHGKLRARLKRELSVVEMFRYPTINALAKHLKQPAQPASSARADKLNDQLTAGKQRLQKIFRQERRGSGDGQSMVQG